MGHERYVWLSNHYGLHTSLLLPFFNPQPDKIRLLYTLLKVNGVPLSP